MVKKVAVLGSGSWATALVKIFSDSRISVTWVVRSEQQVDFIRNNGYNPKYLSSAALNMKFVTVCSYDNVSYDDTELVIFAIPSAFLSATISEIDPQALTGKRLAVSIKGFVPRTGLTPTSFVQNYFDTDEPVIVIGGPCHAEEIASGKSSYLTVGGTEPLFVSELSASLHTSYLRIISSNDPRGIEYAAILKNIIGIAGGIASGLNYGDNFQAVLVSNAMYEISVFLESTCDGNRGRNLFDSAYFGDLLVTAYSDYSRNRVLGKLVGRGIPIGKALAGMEMIAEGFHASHEFAPIIKKLNLSMPVTNTVYRILHQHANPYHEFKLLEQKLN